jgi:hypothetical protein
MRRCRFLLAAALAFLPLDPSLAQRPTAPLQEFPTEQQAQSHCPDEVVVWLNLPTGIYHFSGERWYGRTNSGAFVCEREEIRRECGRLGMGSN